MNRSFHIFSLVSLLLAPLAGAIDVVSCLKAKPDFLSCAQGAMGSVPIRDCLNADSGYADCRKIEGQGAHARCLNAKSMYAYCRSAQGGAFPHSTCVNADSGYKDCIQWTNDKLRCLSAQGGYDACRRLNSELGHQSCLSAEGNYGECRALGASHNICMFAHRSFRYCRETDGQSDLLCLRVGHGYMECKQAGYPFGFCVAANEGFVDCANFTH